MGSMAITVFATDNGEESTSFAGWFNGRMRLGGCRWGRGWGRYGIVEVSEEYEAKASSIAENDIDVQGLLADGYSVAGVRPIIKASVDADGNVETKATSAIVMLENADAMSHASVWVDLEGEVVTRIVISTRTVIEKA